jgi:hypothetical protein
VLDAKKYAKDSSEIDEAEAFDIGFADAEKGRAANPRPDWTPWLKKAYGEGYKCGSKKAGAKDSNYDDLMDDVDTDVKDAMKILSLRSKDPETIARTTGCSLKFVKDVIAGKFGSTRSQFERYFLDHPRGRDRALDLEMFGTEHPGFKMTAYEAIKNNTHSGGEEKVWRKIGAPMSELEAMHKYGVKALSPATVQKLKNLSSAWLYKL